MESFSAFRPTPEASRFFDPREDADISKNFTLLHGASMKKDEMANRHPLEFSERNFYSNQEKNEYGILRQTLGLYAPLTLQVERRVASQIRRLNFMPSSNLMLENLTGRLDTLEFHDVLNDPLNTEMVGNPHMLMERQLGIL